MKSRSKKIKCSEINEYKPRRVAVQKSEVQIENRHSQINAQEFGVRLHDMQKHFELNRMLHKMRELYFFPAMRRYVPIHIRSCMNYISTKALTGKQKVNYIQLPQDDDLSKWSTRFTLDRKLTQKEEHVRYQLPEELQEARANILEEQVQGEVL